jgi:hypothetical protein
MKGSDLLNAGKANFLKRLEESELVEIEVPEWGGSIYRPVSVSVTRMSRIMQAHKTGELEASVQIILEVAKDENGKPLFREGNKRSLMEEQDPQVVMRLAGQLVAALMPEDEAEIAQNLNQAQPESSTSLPTS